MTSERSTATPRTPVRLLIALGLCASIAPLGSTMMAVALDDLARTLGRDASGLTHGLVTSYLLVSVVGQSPGGRFGDLFGHARALRIGQALIVGGAVLGAAGSALWMLVAARVLTAAGGALVVPCAFAVMRIEVPVERRGRAFGAFGSMMSLAAAIGPMLGAALVDTFGGRAVFWVPLPLVAASALLARLPARGGTATPGTPFDWPGTVLLAAGLVTLVASLRSPAQGGLGVAMGVALLVVFVAWERRAAGPVLDPRLFGRTAFTAGALVVALQNLAMYALLFQIPLYFQGLMGARATDVGPAMMAMMGAMVVLSTVGGRWSERVGARVAASAGVTLSLAGLAGLWGLTGMQTPADAVPGLVLVGAGLGLATAPAQAAAMDAAPRAQAGSAGGAISTLRYLGGIAGITWLGRLDAGLPVAEQLARHQSSLVGYGVALGLALLVAQRLPGRRVAT